MLKLSTSSEIILKLRTLEALFAALTRLTMLKVYFQLDFQFGILKQKMILQFLNLM
jgi:hypothetical protein